MPLLKAVLVFHHHNPQNCAKITKGYGWGDSIVKRTTLRSINHTILLNVLSILFSPLTTLTNVVVKIGSHLTEAEWCKCIDQQEIEGLGLMTAWEYIPCLVPQSFWYSRVKRNQQSAGCVGHVTKPVVVCFCENKAENVIQQRKLFLWDTYFSLLLNLTWQMGDLEISSICYSAYSWAVCCMCFHCFACILILFDKESLTQHSNNWQMRQICMHLWCPTNEQQEGNVSFT